MNTKQLLGVALFWGLTTGSALAQMAPQPALKDVTIVGKVKSASPGGMVYMESNGQPAIRLGQRPRASVNWSMALGSCANQTTGTDGTCADGSPTGASSLAPRSAAASTRKSAKRHTAADYADGVATRKEKAATRAKAGRRS